jgi:bacteriocin biosynthesis cyclodehydratase domain-containing protein
MFQRPRLKTFLTVFPISETTWGVRGGTDELWRITFRDREAFATLAALLPMLDGAQPLDAIFTQMEAKGISRADVEQLLHRLMDSSLLEDAASILLPPDDQQRHASAISFFSRYTSEGGAAFQARVRASRIGLIGEGELADCLERQLIDAGIGHLVRLCDDVGSPATARLASRLDEPRGVDVSLRPLDREAFWNPDDSQDLPRLFVVAQDTDDTSLLEAMDAFSKRWNVPWLLVRAVESHVGWIGPLFIPKDTACYLSLDARLRGNLPYFSEQQAFRRHVNGANGPAARCGGLRAFADLMASVVVVEATKYLSGFSAPTLAGRFLTVNFMTWEVESHEVLRVPHVGLDVTQPDIFAWKEMPSDALKGHGFDDLIARRS